MTISSNQFSVEELRSLRSWELPDVSDEGNVSRPRISIEDVDSPPRLTVNQLESLQKQAHEEAIERGHKEGYKRGYENGQIQGQKDGYQTGCQEGQQHIGEIAMRLNTLLLSLDQPFRELDEQVEHEIAMLAVAIAKQIIRRELKMDSGQVVAVVREAMKILPAAVRNIRLHLHPEDAELVRSALALEESNTDWEIVEEPLMNRGGCKVDSDTSRIDATIENQLAALVASLFGGEREQDQTAST